MANVQGTFYSATTQRRGVTPVSPPNAVDDPQDPLEPVNPISFLSLTDTPTTYLSQALKGVRVNSGATALEFYTIPTVDVLGTVLTGYTVGSNTALSSTDTVLGAFQKVQGQINARVSGGATNGLVSFGISAGTIGASTSFLYDNTNKILTIGNSNDASLLSVGGTGTRGNLQLSNPFLNSGAFSRYVSIGNNILINSSGVLSRISTSISGGMIGIQAQVGTDGFLDFFAFRNSDSTINRELRITDNLAIFRGSLGLGNVTPTNTLDVNGTARIRTLTAGRVTFAGTDGVLSDDSRLTWDNVNKRLGINSTSPSDTLTVDTTLRASNIGVFRNVRIGLGLNITNPNSNGGAWFTTNSVTQTDGSFQYLQSSRLATRLDVFDGNHIFYSAPAGVEGNTITFTELWRITSDGFFQATGSKRITTTSNGNLNIVPNGTGLVGIGPFATPTNTLDVNGTARIRTINNATGNFLTTSATGVIQQRTAAEVLSDIGAVQSVIAGTGIFIGGTAVNPSVFLTGQALSFHSLGGTGFVYRTSGIVGVRTLTAGAGISITNGDGVSGNPTISTIGKLELWTEQILTTTYADLSTSSGSNSFSATDLPNGSVYSVTVHLADYTNNPVAGSTFFIKIFGREYQIQFPQMAESLWFNYKFEYLIVVGSGASNERLITTKVITMCSSVFAGGSTSAQWFTIRGTGNYKNTDTVDLTTSKKLEVKMNSIDGSPIITYANCKKIN